MDMLYLALMPGANGNFLNEEFLGRAQSRLLELAPNAGEFADCVRVIDTASLPATRALKVNANLLEQRVVCYLERDQQQGQRRIYYGG
jgi:hypothetical protein